MKVRYQRGITLLEILLVLTIAAVIISCAIAYFGRAMSANKVSQAVDLIQQINKAGYEWLQIPDSNNQYQQDFTHLNKNNNGLNNLIDLNLISCANKSCFTNAWGGSVTVLPSNPAKYMLIQLDNLSMGDCANLIQAMQNIAPSDSQIKNQNSCSNSSNGGQLYQVSL